MDGSSRSIDETAAGASGSECVDDVNGDPAAKRLDAGKCGLAPTVCCSEPTGMGEGTVVTDRCDGVEGCQGAEAAVWFSELTTVFGSKPILPYTPHHFSDLLLAASGQPGAITTWS